MSSGNLVNTSTSPEPDTDKDKDKDKDKDIEELLTPMPPSILNQIQELDADNLPEINNEQHQQSSSQSTNIFDNPNPLQFNLENNKSGLKNVQLSNKGTLTNQNNLQDKICLFQNLEDYCEFKRKTHWMASKYFEKMNKIFMIPSILLTSVASTTAFLASSSHFSDYASSWLTLSVGTLGAISTLFQTFSNAYGYGSKEEAHQNAAESYDQIITKVRFEKFNPKSDQKSFFTDIEQQITDTKQRCKYIVPDRIEKKYNDKKYKALYDSLRKQIIKEATHIKTARYIEKLKNNATDISLSQINEELNFMNPKDKNCNKFKCGSGSGRVNKSKKIKNIGENEDIVIEL